MTSLIIIVYLFSHLIISVIRGNIRYKRYKNHTILIRSIKKRAFKSLTFLYSAMLTIIITIVIHFDIITKLILV